jgi:hypothetical protein
MNAIQEVAENMGIRCFSYSGRGMYGKRCLALDIDGDTSLIGAVVEIAAELAQAGEDDALGDLRDGVTDSLGLGTVLYFPGVPYDDSGEPDSRDD